MWWGRQVASSEGRWRASQALASLQCFTENSPPSEGGSSHCRAAAHASRRGRAPASVSCCWRGTRSCVRPPRCCFFPALRQGSEQEVRVGQARSDAALRFFPGETSDGSGVASPRTHYEAMTRASATPAPHVHRHLPSQLAGAGRGCVFLQGEIAVPGYLLRLCTQEPWKQAAPERRLGRTTGRCFSAETEGCEGGRAVAETGGVAGGSHLVRALPAAPLCRLPWAPGICGQLSSLPAPGPCLGQSQGSVTAPAQRPCAKNHLWRSGRKERPATAGPSRLQRRGRGLKHWHMMPAASSESKEGPTPGRQGGKGPCQHHCPSQPVL